jgi:hypothetical protein
MITAVVGWTAGFLLVALVLELNPPISRLYMALTGVITMMTLLGWRRVYFDARLHKPERLAVLRQRAIIVGWSDESSDLENHFKNNPESAFEVIS